MNYWKSRNSPLLYFLWFLIENDNSGFNLKVFYFSGNSAYLSDYQLKNGTLLVSSPGATTYMKSFIQWSSKYTGMIIDGAGIGSFDTLEGAKNKCIDRLKILKSDFLNPMRRLNSGIKNQNKIFFAWAFFLKKLELIQLIKPSLGISNLNSRSFNPRYFRLWSVFHWKPYLLHRALDRHWYQKMGNFLVHLWVTSQVYR